jgi:hypothetical protein
MRQEDQHEGKEGDHEDGQLLEEGHRAGRVGLITLMCGMSFGVGERLVSACIWSTSVGE